MRAERKTATATLIPDCDGRRERLAVGPFGPVGMMPPETKGKQMNKQQIKQARERHHYALASLYYLLNRSPGDGFAMWRKLRRIERDAHAAATAQCNGEPFGGQPFRNESEMEVFDESIRARVAAVFGGKNPPKFHLNKDPRGYALKLESQHGERPTQFDLHADWGGNQILAAEIN